MKFEEGDRVVYPNQGIALIEGINTKEIAGESHEFYSLRLVASSSTVLVPVTNAEQVGLRRLSTKKDLKRLFDVIENEFDQPDKDWKNRYKENVEKMKTGSIFDAAQVLKNLFFLNYEKSLSFREKRMFDRAHKLVVDEIATVNGEPSDMVESSLETILSGAYQRETTSSTSEA